MTPIGFPAQKTQALLSDLLRTLKDRADVARVEAVTGRIADVPDALNGQVSAVMEIEKHAADLEAYGRSIALAETRSDLAQLSMQTLREAADDVIGQATVALQNQALNGLEASSETARSALSTVIAALNVEVGGRGVFAGDGGSGTIITDTDTFLAEIETIVAAAPDTGTAIAGIEALFDSPGGGFETVIYGGGTGDAPPIELAPGERIAYQARADEGPFRDLLRSIGTIAIAFSPDAVVPDGVDRRLMMEAALSDLRNTIDPLNRVSARVGAAEAQIARVKADNRATEATLTQRYNDLAGRDQLQAAADLSAVESQLETLFLTTARFANLSLANFLR